MAIVGKYFFLSIIVVIMLILLISMGMIFWLFYKAVDSPSRSKNQRVFLKFVIGGMLVWYSAFATMMLVKLFFLDKYHINRHLELICGLWGFLALAIIPLTINLWVMFIPAILNTIRKKTTIQLLFKEFFTYFCAMDITMLLSCILIYLYFMFLDVQMPTRFYDLPMIVNYQHGSQPYTIYMPSIIMHWTYRIGIFSLVFALLSGVFSSLIPGDIPGADKVDPILDIQMPEPPVNSGRGDSRILLFLVSNLVRLSKENKKRWKEINEIKSTKHGNPD